MSNAFRNNNRSCWPYSPETLVTCLYSYLRPKNSTSGYSSLGFLVGFPSSTLENIFRSGSKVVVSISSDLYATVQNHPGAAFLIAYFLLLLVFGTIRELSYTYRKRARRYLPETAVSEPIAPAAPAAPPPVFRSPTESSLDVKETSTALSRYHHSSSTSSTSIPDASSVPAVGRLPEGRFNDFLSIFDLAKTSHVPGHTDMILSRLSRFSFPLEWRCPSASMTLLHCAVLGGDERLVKRLLEAGSDVHARNAFGDTCLYLAVYTVAHQGFVSTPEKIVDWKPDEEETTEDEDAVRSASDDFLDANDDPCLLNQSVLDLLLDRGADVNAGNHDGHAPLHYAAAVGHAPLVTFLLDRGGRPEAKNRDGFMPLQIALNNGHLKTASLLQRQMGRKLREEAEQLKEERDIFMQRIVAKKAGRKEGFRRQDAGRNVFSDLTNSRPNSSGSSTSASSFSIPRRNQTLRLV